MVNVFYGTLEMMLNIITGAFTFWFEIPVADSGFTFGQLWIFVTVPFLFLKLAFGAGFGASGSSLKVKKGSTVTKMSEKAKMTRQGIKNRNATTKNDAKVAKGTRTERSTSKKKGVN